MKAWVWVWCLYFSVLLSEYFTVNLVWNSCHLQILTEVHQVFLNIISVTAQFYMDIGGPVQRQSNELTY